MAPAPPALAALASAVSLGGETGRLRPHHPCLEGIPLEDTDVSRKIKADGKAFKHNTLEAKARKISWKGTKPSC